jgi:FAD/FMN-containing dehydrogenase
MTNILEINEQERWVRVQPRVIRDELNEKVSKLNLHFALILQHQAGPMLVVWWEIILLHKKYSIR